jgi:hypothetical protein
VELGVVYGNLVTWVLFLVSGGFGVYSGTAWMWEFGNGRNIYMGV